MTSTAALLEATLPDFAYGSVWLIGAGTGERGHLSHLAVYGLDAADAVIHEPAIAQEILDLVKPPRYREAASPDRSIERSVKLAQDGWRVVLLVEGDAAPRWLQYAARLAKSDIPFGIVPSADEAVIGEAPAGLLLIRRPRVVGKDETGTTIVLIAAPRSGAAAARRGPPASFSMVGIAG